MGVLICAGLAGELLVTSLGFMVSAIGYQINKQSLIILRTVKTYKNETLPLGYGAAVAVSLSPAPLSRGP